MLIDVEAGDTFKYEWGTTGDNPGDVVYEVVNGTGAVVSTGTLVDVGGGSWEVDYTTPSTRGYYVFKSTATVAGKPYKRATPFKVSQLEVD